MKLDWNRVLRTAVQSACGAGVAAITAFAADFSPGAIVSALIQFVCTVAVAVLMNIQRQVEDDDDDETDYFRED